MRKLVARRAVRGILTGAQREAAQLLINLGLVADEAELLELALREFVESELSYVAREWPEETVRRRASELLEKIFQL